MSSKAEAKRRKNLKYRGKQSIRRKALIDLAGGCCVVCGYDRNWAVLQFHHRDHRTKLFPISARRIAGISTARLVKEINKCDLLCANCHGEIHNANKAL